MSSVSSSISRDEYKKLGATFKVLVWIVDTIAFYKQPSFEATIAELSEATGVKSSGYVSRILSLLEQDGMIKRYYTRVGSRTTMRIGLGPNFSPATRASFSAD